MNKVFVYGTLMRGERANCLLDKGVYMGEYVLEDYAIYDLGNFPGIREMSGGSVTGEVYKIPDSLIPRLDAYEGEGVLYSRTPVEVKNGEDRVENAFAYVYLSNNVGRRIFGKWSS